MEPAGKGGEGAQMKKDRRDSTDENDVDCQVCMMDFDGTIQRPRTLPCGHTFCTPCINGLKSLGKVMCPTCRVIHAVPEAGQFPISYTIETFMRRLRGAATTSMPSKPGKDTGDPAPSSVAGTSQEGPEGLSRPIRSMLQEQEAKVLAAIRTCQEVQGQLDQYQTTLAGWGERQQSLEDRLQALLDQSKDARVFLRQEESKVANKREEAQQGEQRLHALVEVLRKVTTEQEAGGALVNAARCTEEERQRVEESQGIFPDVHIVTTINKVMEASNAALEAAAAVHAALDAAKTVQADLETACDTDGATRDPRTPTNPEYSITDKLKDLLAPTLKVIDTSNATLDAATTVQDAMDAATTVQADLETACGTDDAAGDPRPPIHPESSITDKIKALQAPTLETEDLRRLTRTARRLLQAGRLFAIHQQEGLRRHARITLEDGRLYLHSLQDQPLLPCAVTVQMDEVVPAAPPCLVFLDLAWPGSLSRRVFIRLSPDTPLGRQFLLMCTGQRGPTYANTTLFKLYSLFMAVTDGFGGGFVEGGDYEYNNGRGGAALLPNLYVGEYREEGRAGAVCGWIDNPATGAQFSILTGELRNWHFPRVFGDVVGGLEVVVAAAKHRPITEVTVVDCGVVLWE